MIHNRQQPSPMPSHRYRDVHSRVAVIDQERQWPAAMFTTAPLWVPVDLRDGNQALAEPMDLHRKRRMFDLLVGMGYKEIEVGYPSASRADFDFVRSLVGTVPQDVTIVVFTAARADLIEQTFTSIDGLPDVVVHMYTATAPTWREVVLGHSRDALRKLIFEAGERIARAAGDRSGIRFEFSPEVFNLTEPDYVLEICNGMSKIWDTSVDRPVIHNLPATVEISSPNVYADQIEYMHRNLDRRDSVILSVHPHNDRGTGVACAELAVLAGAQRVEGCLFGNGERTGNVDLVTLALNLHAQGIDPMIDFSDIDEIRRTVEYCNRIDVHERHPYAGDLVYTAFSGTHQDAIKKGMIHHRHDAERLGVAPELAPWAVPYLPIDPADVGRDYDAVIRVNSQSGKGGIAYLLSVDHGLDLPRRLQIDFARVVQHNTDTTGTEISSKEIWTLFEDNYIHTGHRTLLSWSIDAESTLTVTLVDDAGEHHYSATGTGPVDAFAQILGVEVLGLSQHSVGDAGVEPAERPENAGVEPAERPGDRASGGAATYVEARCDGKSAWGVGIDGSVVASSLSAVAAAANNLVCR